MGDVKARDGRDAPKDGDVRADLTEVGADDRDDVESVWMHTEGGSIILMDLPLPSDIAARVAKGQIVRVNEDGTAWEPHDDDPDLVVESEGERLDRERRAALEYAELKREHPDADHRDLAVEAAEKHGDDLPEHLTDRPKPAAPKADWVGYAVSVSELSHDEADAMTKAALVERFG